MGVILASASPRRLSLLRQIGCEPTAQIAPEVDESPQKGELPLPYVQRLAKAKAQAIAPLYPEDFILSGDTVVACGRRILPKAEDEATAHQCLSLLSGRRHRVYGGVCLLTPSGTVHTRLVTSHVTFKTLTHQEILFYLKSGEWQGKAGGYAIQGLASLFIRQIGGSYSNVVGFPLFEVGQLLRGTGAWFCD